MKRAFSAAAATLMLMLTVAVYSANAQVCPYGRSGSCPAYGNQARRPARSGQKYQRRADTRPRYSARHRGYGITGGVPGVRLTAEQQRRVASIRRDTQTRSREVMRNWKITPQERVQRWNDIRREGHDRAIGVLTPDQRQQYHNWWGRRYGNVPAPRQAPTAG